MSLTRWGFVYLADGADPARDTSIVDTGSCRTVLIGMAAPDQVVDVARRLVDDGAQLIELCGGFGPQWTARVLDAVGDRVPVGAVTYGTESVPGLHTLFGPPDA
ncbi:DUF6506 family protein [Amycolatopsis sp. NPDC058986]|uniref:DUF6506 family protein n=1 Tax=unclassified Amycolatopsis TaxID=2618356 RepID=UPI00366D0B4F